MKYVLLNDELSVAEIIHGEDPVFPGVPIEKRYPKKFIDQLIQISDETPVEQNWIYDPDTKIFSKPPEPEPLPTPDPDPEGEATTTQVVNTMLGVTE